MQRPRLGVDAAGLPGLGVELGQEDRVAGDLDVALDLAEHLQGPVGDVVDGLGHPRGQRVGELQLGQRPDGGLLHDVRPPRTQAHHRVVDTDVAVDEHVRLGHFDVVEDAQRVLLVEAGGERGVERMGTGADPAVTAQENQTGGVHRHGERQGVLGRPVAGHRHGRVDGLLVGVRGQGGQQPGTTHDDRVGRLADLVQRHRVVHQVAVGLLVDGRVDDRVGQ